MINVGDSFKWHFFKITEFDHLKVVGAEAVENLQHLLDLGFIFGLFYFVHQLIEAGALQADVALRFAVAKELVDFIEGDAIEPGIEGHALELVALDVADGFHKNLGSNICRLLLISQPFEDE